MPDYTLSIIVNGVDQTQPAVAGMERLGVGGVAAGNLITSALQQAAGAVTGFIGASISAAGDFQQNMNVLQAASGATAAQMQALGAEAMALGNDMTLPGASASDAATAMLELSKAGLSVNDTMAAAQGTLQLAAAAETDAATAAGVVAGALNAFGLEGSAATQIADQLAAGANASAASMTDLSQGFQAAGFAFNATGQKTDDLIASLAMLTNVGLTGSDAGTALKNAMMQLMAPTTAASDTMKQYGINVRDAQGNMLPMRDIIGALQAGLSGLSPAARDAALKTMLMGDGMKAMLPLLNAGVSGFDAMKEKVNQAGAAQAMAQAQMQGYNGALAGVSNAVETLQLALGSALIPVLTELLNMVAPIINGVTTFTQALFGSADAFASLGPIAQVAVAGLQMLGEMFGELAGEAVAWGSNIIGSLADGMMGAADAVIGILNMIGGMIADLLMPGSPPKLLPGLTDWGAGAIAAYMQGWSQADMSVFNGIGDAIKSSLEGIAKASGDKGMNVAGMVLGSQGQIATAINEIHNLGSVSEGTFNAIVASAGPAGPQIAGVMHAYFDLEAATQNVARAQDELNSVTSAYAAQLDPLKAQMRSIQDQKAAIQDQQKLAVLYTEVADSSTDATKRQLDNLEIQEIQTRQQIRTTEAERDTAVGAAKAKLDAAKSQQDAAKAALDSQKGLMDAQNKSNALVGEQTKAMAGAAGAMHSAGGAMAGMAQATAPLADAVKGISSTVQTVNGTLGAVSATAAATGATFASVGAQIQSVFAPAIAFVQSNFAAFQGALMGVGVALAGLFVAFVVWPAILGAVGAVLGVIGAALAFLLSPIGLLIIAAAALGAAISTNFMGIGTLFAGLTPIFNTVLLVIGQVIAAFGVGGLAGAFAALQAGLAVVGPMLMAWGAQLGTVLLGIGQLILTNVLTWGQAFIAWIAPYVPIVLAALVNFALSIGSWIVAQAPAFIAQLVVWGMAFVDWITPYAAQALASLAIFVSAIWAWVQVQAPLFIAQLAAWGLAFVNWIGPMIGPALAALGVLIVGVLGWIGAQVGPILGQLAAWGAQFIAWIAPMIGPAIAALAGLAGAFFGWIAAQAAPILAQLGTWAQAFIAWIAPATVQFLSAWPGMLSSFLDWIASAVPPLLAKLGMWALAFIQWIGPMIPPFLVALAAVALAIGAFIVETGATLLVKLAQWALAFIGWIAPLIGKIPSALQGIQNSIAGWIAGAAVSLASAALSMGKSIVSGIISGVGSMAGALGDKLKSMAKGALDAAKSALGIHSPSTVFADQVGTTIPEGIAAGIVAATPKATAATVELASKIVDLISKGADAFGKLRDLGHIPMSAVTDFTTTIQEAMNLFGTMTAGWNRSMISAAGQFQAKAGETVDLIAKGVDAMSKLRDFQAVPAAAISAFADALGFAITEIVRISTFEMRVALMGAVEFAAGAGKVIEIVAKGVEAFTKLATLGAPVAGSFLNFANQVSWLVMRMGQVAAQTDGSAVAAAGRFADGAGKVIAILSNGVDGLAKLATLAAPVQGMFVNFANQISWLVMRMAQVAVQMSADAVTKAAAFADGAGKVIGIIGSGVDGLAKLATLGAPVQGSFLNFGNQIGALVAAVSRVAATMNAQGVAAAGVFAEGAGKVLGIIGSGVDGLTKLATFEGVTEASVAVFARSVSLVVTWIQMVSLQFSTEGAAAAAVFAEGAGKILGIIANGVAGLAKLGEFQGVTEASVALFARAVSTIVKWIQMVSLQFTAEGTAAAALFAESAGKIMGIISSGVDGLTKLETFGGSTGAAIDLFTESLTMFTSRFAAGVASFSAEALANAALFAESAGKVLGILSNGVTGLAALQDLKPIAEGSIQKFVEMTNLLMTQIGAAAAGFSTDALAAAGKFADAAGKSVGILKSGVEGFYQVDTFAGVSAAAIGRFADGVKLTVDAMVQLSTMFTAEALTAAQRFAVVAEASTEFLKKGATGFDRLGEMKVKPGEGLDAFAVGIQQLVATMVRLSGIVSADMLTEANRIAIGIDQILTVLMASIKGFKDVADIVGGGTLGAVGNGLTSGIVKMLADIQAVVIPPAQNIGHSISVGLANGITAGAPAIQNAVFAAINAALAAARAALGIASPSKVFEQQIGMQMSAGMAQGVLGGMGQVNAAVGAVSNGAVTAGGATGSTNNSYGGDTYSITINQQPGQDARALVDTVMREIENRRRMRG